MLGDGTKRLVDDSDGSILTEEFMVLGIHIGRAGTQGDTALRYAHYQTLSSAYHNGLSLKLNHSKIRLD